MLKQMKDAPGNPPYWYCTKCNTPFEALQAANRHACNGNPPAKPAFQSFSRGKV
jgi:hypothetical protein